MSIKRKSDGKEYGTLMDAVQDFRCPGPCSPDCQLYPVHEVATVPGAVVHKCHPEYVKAHPHEIADLIGCSFEPGMTPVCAPSKRFIAVVRSSAVRDVQIAITSDADLLSDDWYDPESPEVYIGLFTGNEDQVRLDAAAYAKTDPANVRLIDTDRDDA